MDMLKGQCTINGVDIYERYGAFLAFVSGDDPLANYTALLAPPEVKEQRKVDYAEVDGARLPTTLTQRWKEREIPLQFCIVAKDRAQFETLYYGFLNFLKDGDRGWLNISIKQLSRTWRVYLRRITPYKQLTDFDGEVLATFTAVFEEPNPNF